MTPVLDAQSLLQHLEGEVTAATDALNKKKGEVAIRAAELREAEAEATLLEGSIMQLRRMINAVRRAAASHQIQDSSNNTPNTPAESD